MRQSNTNLLLPAISRQFQQISRRKQNKLLGIYCLTALTAIVLIAVCKQSFWQSFALGLLAPGASFLLHAGFDSWVGIQHIFAFIAVLTFFAASLVLWFATGNVLTPPIIWLASALLGAYWHRHEIPIDSICGQPAFASKLTWLLSGLIVFILLARKIAMVIGAKRRRQANAYLKTCPVNFNATTPQEEINEFSPNDLKLMRFVLDRALQPIENFEGFEWIDQFQTAAVRYQLHFMGYALSMTQHTHLSAFGGYLDTAQENLIQKQKDVRVWRYWQLENTWGNLNQDADPIKNDNIMYSGFCATQITMYQASSGNHHNKNVTQFNLTQPSGKQFSYDLSSIVSTLVDNNKSADYGLMPCEPNWAYSLCNIITAAGIKRYDQDTWLLQQSQFRQALENEFISPSGKFITCRSTYTGLALPSIGGTMPLAMPCFFLNALMPDIALRQWLLCRKDMLTANGEINTLNKKSFWPIDTGNYSFSRAAGYAATALAARELGDTEVASLCLAALDQDCPASYENNGMYREKSSVWGHAVELMARSTTQNSFKQLINQPTPAQQHPKISDVPYPAVLVAHASFANGYLKAILYPGESGGVYSIKLANLAPNTAYQCRAPHVKTFQSDSAGNACIQINVEDRTVVLISALERD